MDAPHYGGQDEREEAALIKNSLQVLRSLSGQPVSGWISPAKSQSMNTPRLLVENGIEYMCDWVNDDMPYRFRTAAGELTAMPLCTELEDRYIILNNGHSEAEYAEQVMDAFDYLYAEAEQQGGRMLALYIHPWMLGQPHRIGALEQVFKHIMSHAGVWSATGSDINQAWLQAQA